MNKDYWVKFYKKSPKFKESSFARWALPYLPYFGSTLEFGCGNGRDIQYFRKSGVDAIGVDQSFFGENIHQMGVSEYMRKYDSPDAVYTRFFWHSIRRNTQLAILRWVKGTLLIEARTTEDSKKPKIFKRHKRNYVSVPRIVEDLKRHGFQIVALEEGTGFSKYKGEDPHLVRIIAQK